MRHCRSLVAAGNTKSQGRYLFAGSRSQDQPYDFNGDYVKYSGNEGVLRSYVDLERLFDTNLPGTDVFGGISKQIQGSDLNPQLSADTLLSTINGGQGIARNAAISVSVNTGSSTVTSVIDLSHAVTLGDVAKLIERGAPAGTEIVADVTGDGLKLSIVERNDQRRGSGARVKRPAIWVFRRARLRARRSVGNQLESGRAENNALDSLLGHASARPDRIDGAEQRYRADGDA